MNDRRSVGGRVELANKATKKGTWLGTSVAWGLLHYLRYINDFLILMQKRWPLRRAIRGLNQYLQTEGFTCHPDKTQIGRLSRGFDWCGIDFTVPLEPRISDRSLTKHRERCLRLDG